MTDPKCTVPPTGWTCTRKAGHDGPCAATTNLHPLDAAARDELERLAVELRDAIAACNPFKFTLTPFAAGSPEMTAEQSDVWRAYGALTAACTPERILALVAAARRGVEDTAPNYEAAQREFHRVTAYWAPEWVSDSDMFAKMLDTVLAAARAHPEDTTR